MSKTYLQLRWLVRSDMPRVMEIENASFEYTWTEEYFLTCLRQRNCIAMVAELNGYVVGFIVYELQKQTISILNIAVDPDFRHQEIGTRIIARMIDKLTQQRRREINLTIRETNVAAQFFFKAMGFRAVSVLRNYYDQHNEDAYIFAYVLERSEQEFAPGLAPSNRISNFLDKSDV